MFGRNPCFNGRTYLDYQLSFASQLQEFWLSLGFSFVTFLDSNINHNQQMKSGIMLDVQLEKYLKRAVSHENTMFLIFADHGSRTVSKYISTQMPEGDIDRYNPALFVILPKNERMFFSQSQLDALVTNQNRLLTHRDLHYLVAKFSTATSQGFHEKFLTLLGRLSTSLNAKP